MGLLYVQIIMWFLYTVSSRINPYPDITDEKFINDCVRFHNDNRSSVNPPASNMLYMTWDEGLAVTARAWARHCVFRYNIYENDVKRLHPVFTPVGENLWVRSLPRAFNVKLAIRSWVDEGKYYDYETDVCQEGKMCGNYKQVVWATSYKVGCAVQKCPNGVKAISFKAEAIFVCNYATAGNYYGEKPYQEGKACSACKDANDQCQNKLCHNQMRDRLKSYYWMPDWDTALVPKDPSLTTEDPFLATGDNALTMCIASSISVMPLRPLPLFLTFVTAFREYLISL
ncbi:hypothetical protein UPYG_G00349360 [Umbra pygmaea]|uniref:SCP domain-containing protein n=1 Tax=Umbra pygmaea TaxID=75934 RepID=A0ABD0VZP7_UMBPY